MVDIMKMEKNKLFIIYSVFFIGFLLSTSSLNIVNTNALLEVEHNQHIIDSFDRSDWKWTTTEVVSTESASTSVNPSIDVDSGMNVYIAWEDYSDYAGAGDWDEDIFYKCWNASTESWTITEVVSTESLEISAYPSLAVDSAGNVHITWQDWTNYAGSGSDMDIFYKRWNVTSETWTTTEVVSTESTGYSYRPSIAVDSERNAHISWEDHTNYDSSGSDVDIFYKRLYSSNYSWTTTEVVSTESTLVSEETSLTVDILGNVHISWEDTTNYDSSGADRDIFYKRWDAFTSSWTTSEVVSTESTGNSHNPSIDVDTFYGVHIAWYDGTDINNAGTDSDILYKKWEASSSWTTTDVVSTESTGYSAFPSLAVDSMGIVHILWEDATDYNNAETDRDIFYKRWDSSQAA